MTNIGQTFLVCYILFMSLYYGTDAGRKQVCGSALADHMQIVCQINRNKRDGLEDDFNKLISSLQEEDNIETELATHKSSYSNLIDLLKNRRGGESRDSSSWTQRRSRSTDLVSVCCRSRRGCTLSTMLSYCPNAVNFNNATQLNELGQRLGFTTSTVLPRTTAPVFMTTQTSVPRARIIYGANRNRSVDLFIVSFGQQATRPPLNISFIK
ncbi:uncharacterized protein LOC106066815 [Biomphalaria glabrata]|uniref:Uncharacterized protein LOC106066815 n=1 Tax=Biomphalaria glabrata TaxID=6526 RepID=A0A9W3AK96_BIOGL|nr:uncharacterized protein LOC106066815 [Biomphalaria glabrata]